MGLDEVFKIVIGGLPNFLGLVFCIYVMTQANKELREQNKYLISVIINKDNCDEDDTDK